MKITKNTQILKNNSGQYAAAKTKGRNLFNNRSWV